MCRGDLTPKEVKAIKDILKTLEKTLKDKMKDIFRPEQEGKGGMLEGVLNGSMSPNEAKTIMDIFRALAQALKDKLKEIFNEEEGEEGITSDPNEEDPIRTSTRRTTTRKTTTAIPSEEEGNNEEGEEEGSVEEEFEDDEELPPIPKHLKINFVLYAVNTIKIIRCTDISKPRSLYRKNAKLFIYVRGSKQQNGKTLHWNHVDRLKPKGSNFINMAYIKGDDRLIPIRDSAIILIHFLICLRDEGANIDDVVIGGGHSAKAISKFLRQHDYWFD